MNKQTAIKILKIVHWISIVFLCFWVLTPILGIFIPLELASNDSKQVYITIRFYGFPIAATLLILTGMIKRRHTLTLIITKVIVAMCVAVFTSFVTMIVLFASMCAWTTDKVFFQNKQNASIEIVQRSYDCGAMDSSRPIPKVFKVRKITSDFIWATKIDTNRINKNEWIRIDNKEQHE